MRCHLDCPICSGKPLVMSSPEDAPNRFGKVIVGVLIFAGVAAAILIGAALGMSARAAGVEACMSAIKVIPGERM